MNFNINPFESNPGWDIIKTLYHYYGLKDYLEFWYSDRFDEDSIKEILAYNENNEPGDKYFWKEIMVGNILKGQKLRLLNFQISPWFPRKPGLFWTYDAAIARERAFRHHVEEGNGQGFVLDIYGKTLMTELGGVGCVNFRKDRDFVLLTATASGNTEEGIPIVCRNNVWNQIESEFVKGKMIEVDLQGHLVNIDRENDSFFLRAPSIPRVAILVNSILNIKLKSSRLRINVTPWTVFETRQRHKPYGFTYVNHNLFEQNIEDSKNWILNYIDNHNGKVILTDFDENLHQLNAVFPLNDLANGSILSTKFMEYSQKILRDFKDR
jgi:hypothetical protein